jgi:predicted nucleotidyltransferase
MDAHAVARIDARLDDIARAEGITIPLAIESGSRAWGFPSPDSDYDCRFIFVRPAARYLSLWPDRDVIETPVDGDLDVNGWDIGKALKLLARGNATVIEWLTSPISYRGDAAFRQDMLELARKVADRRLIARHYLHLGERQRRAYFADNMQVPQKKIFYALRPAAALRWLGRHPDAAVAPMHFPVLLAECDPPAEVAAIAAELMARKAMTRELGAELLPAPIGAFIDSEFAAARDAFPSGDAPNQAEIRTACDAFFRRWINRL